MIIGLCNGCFDGLHAGHKYFLDTALAQCDHLVVGLNSDVWVRSAKGRNRPGLSFYARFRALRKYSICISVIPFDGEAYLLALAMNPDIVFRGFDQNVAIPPGMELRVIDKGPDISTTSLVRNGQKP